MESSVSLQEPFSYALWPVLVTGLLVLGVVLYFAAARLLEVYRKKKNTPPVVRKRPVDTEKIRAKYISELDGIYEDFKSGRLDVRAAYQRMSMCIRRFVHAMTGIRVQNCTLSDIGKLDMPVLYGLVAEYYAPEFARKSQGDVEQSLIKTRSFFERWR